MAKDPKPVSEVRKWRQEMMDSWKGKTREEIRAELRDSGKRLRDRIQARRKARAS